LSSVLLKRVMSWPSILMLPPVGSISRKMVRPTVDLPQPDSPTRPSVSPALIEKLTPSTANTVPAARCSSPLRIGKCFLRSLTSMTGASSMAVTEQFLRAPACRPMARPLLLIVGILAAAAILGIGAARREHAARRQVGQSRHHAGNFLQPLAGVVGLAAHQRQARN